MQAGNRRETKLLARKAGVYLDSVMQRLSMEARMNIVKTRSRGHGRLLLRFIFFFILSISVACAAMSRNPPPNTEDKALEAAEGMEALMVNMLIQEMRKSVQESELVPVSQGERIFRQMLDNEYARVMSSRGELGIKDLVLAEIHGKR